MAFLIGTDPGLRQTRTPTRQILTDGVGFTANSSTTITLTNDPGTEDHVVISFDGIVQHHSTYTVSGTTVTFNAAIPAGVAEIEASFVVTVSSITVPDGSVSTSKIVDANVTTSKILNANITEAKLAALSVSTAKLQDNAVSLAKLSGGTANKLLGFDSSGDPAEVDSPAAAFESQLLHARDERPNNTSGGSSVGGTWHTRILNTIKTNEITGASVVSNQITLPAGTYYADCDAPTKSGTQFKLVIYNVTDSSYALVGSGAYATSEVVVFLKGRFTIAATKVLELRQWASATRATDGLGYKANSGQVEIYADARIWKVA